jgi:two-component system NtrC family sensor kinase
MRVSESVAAVWKRWTHGAHSLSSKLVILLVASMTITFGLLGYLNIRLHRQHLENSTLVSAEQISDAVKRSATYYMLRNQRDGLYHSIVELGNEPGIVRIRIINREGRISFSSDLKEINTLVDKSAEACYACHNQDPPTLRLDRPQRFRTYRLANGERVLGIITPIENSPACATAECHAHPASDTILGVLDTNVSLGAADASLAESTRQMVMYTFLAVIAISFLSAMFVWRVVHDPLKALKTGTERLSSGQLGYQLDIRSHDELADLAASFNAMSRDLGEAREEITAWTRKLEARVDQKTQELNRAHEQMLIVEKMASIGKLAAVVAHEINNPLAGILTYAKLLKKRFARENQDGKNDILSSLDLIESESRRCGEIVKNLMTFGRATSMSCEPADLNGVIKRCVQLVGHKLQLANIELQLNLAADLPPVRCDTGQIEQLILALVMNAIDAMPGGGNLSLGSKRLGDSPEVQITVEDNGVGIPPQILPSLFEPFFTTKERGHGLGLGLAISKTIVERHHGRIQVVSEPGHGTAFTITLPLQGTGVPSVGSGVAA